MSTHRPQDDQYTKEQNHLHAGTGQTGSGSVKRSRKVPAAEKRTTGSARQARTQGKQQAPFAHKSTAGGAGRQTKPKAKSQQHIQPATSLQSMAALAKQPVTKQLNTPKHTYPAGKQQERLAAKPVPKRKPVVRKPSIQPAPVITQAPPLQSPSPLWVRCVRGIKTGGSVLWFLCGGLGGIILACFFLIPQAFFAVLIVTFPVRFPNCPLWSILLGSGLGLTSYIIFASMHCAAAKEAGDVPVVPIIGYYTLFLLTAYLLDNQLTNMFFS